MHCVHDRFCPPMVQHIPSHVARVPQTMMQTPSSEKPQAGLTVRNETSMAEKQGMVEGEKVLSQHQCSTPTSGKLGVVVPLI